MIKVNTENTVSLNLVSLYTTLALQKVMNGLFKNWEQDRTLTQEAYCCSCYGEQAPIVFRPWIHFSLITQIQHYFPLSINLILTRYVDIITFYLASLSFRHRFVVLGCRCWPFNRWVYQDLHCNISFLNSRSHPGDLNAALHTNSFLGILSNCVTLSKEDGFLMLPNCKYKSFKILSVHSHSFTFVRRYEKVNYK